MQFLHQLIIAVYLVMPLAAGGVALWLTRRTRTRRHLISFGLTCFSAAVLGTVINVFYAYATSARPQVVQVMITTYLFISLLSLLKGLSWLLKEGAGWAFRLYTPASLIGPHGWGWMARVFGAVLVRVVVLFAIGLPYILSVGMVFRPKVVSGDDPKKQLGVAYQTVSFDSTDGVGLSAWWIPAPPVPPNAPADAIREWARRTVILCHGLGANKANQLALVRDLVPNGYNVLAFDFRAHGESGGQLSSFGDRERYDVLGAVRWVREQHPRESHKLYGLGISMGGAALIAAAADDSPEGRAFDALAVFSTYDNFPEAAEYLAGNVPIPKLPSLIRGVLVPVMSVHVGADLNHFAPGDLVDHVAPRPLMILHGRGDSLIPFEFGVRLYDRASQPKLRLWIGESLDLHNGEKEWVVRMNPRQIRDANGKFHPTEPNGPVADHNNVIYDDEAVRAIRMFFEKAEPVL